MADENVTCMWKVYFGLLAIETENNMTVPLVLIRDVSAMCESSYCNYGQHCNLATSLSGNILGRLNTVG